MSGLKGEVKTNPLEHHVQLQQRPRLLVDDASLNPRRYESSCPEPRNDVLDERLILIERDQRNFTVDPDHLFQHRSSSAQDVEFVSLHVELQPRRSSWPALSDGVQSCDGYPLAVDVCSRRVVSDCYASDVQNRTAHDVLRDVDGGKLFRFTKRHLVALPSTIVCRSLAQISEGRFQWLKRVDQTDETLVTNLHTVVPDIGTDINHSFDLKFLKHPRTLRCGRRTQGLFVCGNEQQASTLDGSPYDAMNESHLSRVTEGGSRQSECIQIVADAHDANDGGSSVMGLSGAISQRQGQRVVVVGGIGRRSFSVSDLVRPQPHKESDIGSSFQSDIYVSLGLQTQTVIGGQAGLPNDEPPISIHSINDPSELTCVGSSSVVLFNHDVDVGHFPRPAPGNGVFGEHGHLMFRGVAVIEEVAPAAASSSTSRNGAKQYSSDNHNQAQSQPFLHRFHRTRWLCQKARRRSSECCRTGR